jgi:hypothetical protein
MTRHAGRVTTPVRRSAAAPPAHAAVRRGGTRGDAAAAALRSQCGLGADSADSCGGSAAAVQRRSRAGSPALAGCGSLSAAAVLPRRHTACHTLTASRRRVADDSDAVRLWQCGGCVRQCSGTAAANVAPQWRCGPAVARRRRRSPRQKISCCGHWSVSHSYSHTLSAVAATVGDLGTRHAFLSGKKISKLVKSRNRSRDLLIRRNMPCQFIQG